MRTILNDNVALRSFRLVPYAYYLHGVRNAMGLTREEFELLSHCDGETELKESDLLTALARKGLIRPAKAGERLTAWQKPRVCDNRYFPAVNWAITGKCNYNCLHCFMAADNAHMMSEFSLEECGRFIAECDDCGVNAFTLTGGEPMMHPYFLEILRDIHGRGMYVEELNTNGFFITREVLRQMKDMGCVPLMKISFDGLGHHDYLRNRKGAEANALEAIRLCKEMGFAVKSQTNVHRGNVETMLPTANLLDEMGVDEMRIIRTTEAPRWVANAGDACLQLTEYYDAMLSFTKAYLAKPHRMSVDEWQFLQFNPQNKTYHYRPVLGCFSRINERAPVCKGNRGLIAVTSRGEVVPCNQMSGYYEKEGMSLGNVKAGGLRPLLQEGAYLDAVTCSVGKLFETNAKCGACAYKAPCLGGCRAIALALTGDTMASDPAKCLYFENGYLEKTDAVFAPYRYHCTDRNVITED